MRFDTPVFHQSFEDHQEAAGRRVVTAEEAEDVWYGERRFIRNTKRQGAFLMRGLTRGGRDITVVVLPTGEPTTWLLYTAW